MLSASRIKLFHTCARKWYYKYIEEIPDPQTQATNFGSDIHKQIEQYYLANKTPDAPHAFALLQHLPKPSPTLVVEKAFSIPIEIAGIDCLIRGASDLIDTETHTIYDHKTTSNFKYVLKEESLLTDPQPLIYGMYYRLNHNRHVPDINIQYTYVLSKQTPLLPQTRIVKTKQSLTILEDGVASLHDPIRDMNQITETRPSASDIPANTSACFMFRRCPYASVCPSFGKQKEVNTMASLLEQLAAKSREAPKVIAPTPVADADDVADTPEKAQYAEVAKSPLPLLDKLQIDFGTPVDIMPPDHQPDVSVLEPPPPEPIPSADLIKTKTPNTRKKANKAAPPTDNLKDLVESAMSSSNMTDRLLAHIIKLLAGEV